MLLSWERKRANAPRFLPSGSRFGPYFFRRLEASAVARPFSVSVASRDVPARLQHLALQLLAER